ncbi:protein BREAKING OF ASYMMETRY IN THE STOMATAL LINEAGE [Rhodamnia argentea]|uniref:Protein BREAKING OF ASYMMETRY IN THE STOMATAL LINEAGE n=1 Tax=Rhodamnia argentea TaxID=178133 RepID=A0A8B8P7Q2_9MYRT|nr:protein BREAKING OF ASYMMETRY IN THE STOMATAL LINEAGE [Rhodamnia argentea]
MGVDQRDESRCNTTMKKRSCDAVAKIRGDGAAAMTKTTSWKVLPEDEDYIVFCFRDDGAFDVVKDNHHSKSSAQVDGATSTAPRPVNRPELGHSKMEALRNEVVNNTRSKDEGSGSRGGVECESTNKKDKKDGSDIRKETTERTDSIKSDGSGRGSFSFPILRWEWTGSPVQMPKPEGEGLPYSKKQRVPRVRFQCCRF